MRNVMLAATIGLGLLAMPTVVVASEKGNETTEAGEKLVCKYVMRTGTRFKSKICKTAEQWEKLTEASRAQAKEMIDKPAINVAENP